MRISFSLAAVLFGLGAVVPGLLAQDVFVGSYLGSGNPQAIDVYRPHGIASAAAPAPGSGVNVNTRRPLYAFRNSNGITVLGLMSYQGADIQAMNYDAMTGLMTGAATAHASPLGRAARAMVLNAKKTIAYLGMASPASTTSQAPYSFREIYSMDIAGAPGTLGTPQLLGSLDSDCYDMDIHPVTGHIYAACYGDLAKAQVYEIIDFDPANGSKTAYPLGSYSYQDGNLSIEPTQGNFAYLTGARDFSSGTPQSKILSISITSSSVTFNGEISTPALPWGHPSSVMFHPQGQWAYIPLRTNPARIGVLDTVSGGPATALTAAKTFVLPAGTTAAYQGIASKDRLYVVGVTSSDFILQVLDLDAAFGPSQGTLTLDPNKPALVVPTPGTHVNGIALIEEALSTITAKVDPAIGPPVVVSLNTLPPKDSTTIVVPGNTIAPIDAGNQIQPVPALTTGPRFNFLGWAKNTPCSDPLWSAALSSPSDPVPQGQTDTYCACFEKQWYVGVTITGACTDTTLNGTSVSNGGGIWVTEGSTVTGAGTPPAGGSISVSAPVTADAAGKSVTITCAPGSGGCSPASSLASLRGWWSFEETDSVMHDRAGVNNYVIESGSVARVAGKVGNALSFGTIALNSANSVRTGDAAAEVNFTSESFTIDAWIRYQSNIAGFRSIVDKFGGDAGNIGGGYSFFMDDGVLRLSITPAGQTSASARVWTSGGVNVADDQWHHVAVVVDRAKAAPDFYVDGQLQPLASSTGPMFDSTFSLANSARLNVGGFNFAGSNTRGLIDELEIFAEALPGSTIFEIFNAQSTGKCPRNDEGCVPAPPGLVSWYPFTTVSGQNYLNDHATVNSAVIRTNVAPGPSGKVGDFLYLASTAQYLETATSAAEHNFGTGQFSFDFWIRAGNNLGGPVRIIAEKMQYNSAGTAEQQGWSIRLNTDGRIHLVLASGGQVATYSAPDPITTPAGPGPNGTWKFVAITVDRTPNPQFHDFDLQDVGGTLISGPNTVLAANLDNNVPMRIGGRTNGLAPSGPPSAMEIALDEFEIFNRRVPTEDLFAIYSSAKGKCEQTPGNPQLPTPGACVPQSDWQPGLVAWYGFENAGSTFVTDLSGSNNHGSVIGGTTQVPGQVGNSIATNPSRYLEAPSSNSLNFGFGPFSADFWMRGPITTLNDVVLLNKLDGNTGWWFGIKQTPPAVPCSPTFVRFALVLRDNNGVREWYSPCQPFLSTAWRLAGFRYQPGPAGLNPASVTFFLDGAPLAAAFFSGLPAVPNVSSPAPFRAGVPSWNTGLLTPFTGDLDEIELFNLPKPDTFFAQIFAAGALGKCNKPAPQQQTGVPVTVNTSLVPPQGVFVGVQGVGTGPDVYSNPNTPTGAQIVFAPQKKIDNANANIEWNLKNWSFNNTPNPLWTNPNQPVTIPSGGGTYTANYDQWWKLTVVVNGPCNSSLSTGYYPSNPNPFINVTGAANPIISYQGPSVGGGTLPPIASVQNGTMVPISFPGGTLTIDCGSLVPVTVNTNPANIGVTVGVGGQSGLNSYSTSLPASSAQTLTNTPVSVIANNTLYAFANWTPSGPGVTLPASGSAAYTANYSVAGYTVTATGCGVTISSPIGAIQQNPLVYPPNAPIVLTANPTTGQQFTNFQVTIGGSTTTVTANPANIQASGPVSVTANCGAPTNVTLTVTTAPVAGLNVRIGTSGSFVPGPISQQVPAGQTQTVATQAQQVLNSTGYNFTGWSTGGSTASTTVQPSTNFTATANFQVACYLVTVTGTAGGTVALNPASGGLAGFPSNCYAPGVQVRILATANSGFALQDVAINNGGVTSTVTTANTPINVNGPVTANATFVPRPATVSSISAPAVVSGTTYRSNVFFTNPTPTPGSNLRVTAVSFQTTAGSGSVTLTSPTLPIVYGNLPANGQSSTQQIQYNIPASVTSFIISLTVEVQNSNGVTFTNNAAVGHTRGSTFN